jgi:hypothetical protein
MTSSFTSRETTEGFVHQPRRRAGDAPAVVGMVRLLLLVLVPLLCLASSAYAQSSREGSSSASDSSPNGANPTPEGSGAQAGRSRPASPAGSLNELLSEVRKFGEWEDQYEYWAPSIKDYWERQDWNSEADLFARDLVLDVGKIPPWEMRTRLNRFNELLVERYDLTDDQERMVQRRLVRETAGFLLKHTPVLLSQTREWLDLYEENGEITPELVARWTRESEDLVRDAQARVNRAAKEFAGEFTAEQRAILERDLASSLKRQVYYNTLRERWLKGGWRPEDWRMKTARAAEAFRPSNRKSKGRAEAKAEPRLPSQTTRNLVGLWKDYDPSTWIHFVRRFEQYYRLDEGQRTSARSIHTEVVARADHFLEVRREALEAIPVTDRSKNPAYGPVRRIFTELQLRLEALCTTAQLSEHAPKPSEKP